VARTQVSVDQNSILPEMAAASCGVPLATWERMFSVASFRDLLEKRRSIAQHSIA
jgi:hypothetical protein